MIRTCKEQEPIFFSYGNKDVNASTEVNVSSRMHSVSKFTRPESGRRVCLQHAEVRLCIKEDECSTEKEFVLQSIRILRWM